MIRGFSSFALTSRPFDAISRPASALDDDAAPGLSRLFGNGPLSSQSERELMRKLFWCSVAVAVSTACGLYLASKSVDHSPVAAIGDALRNPGGEEAASASRGTVEEGGALPVAVPVEGTALPEATEPSPVVAVADPSAPGHILIAEEGMTAIGMVPTPCMPLSGSTVGTQPPAPAPSLMPYCNDNDEPGLGKMPYAGTEESEPGSAAAVEDPYEPLRQAARESVTDPMSGADEAVCPEDQGHHEVVCPYTGRSYPEYRVCPPAPEPANDAEPKNNNTPLKESHRSESKKVSPPVDETLKGSDDSTWPIFSLDTMEFRPSDAGFQPMQPHPF